LKIFKDFLKNILKNIPPKVVPKAIGVACVILFAPISLFLPKWKKCPKNMVFKLQRFKG